MNSPEKFDVENFVTKHFDHHSNEYAKHTHEILNYMGNKCPIARSDKYDGYWVVGRYQDIAKIARDDDTFSSAQGILVPEGQSIRGGFLGLLKNPISLLRNLGFLLFRIPQLKKEGFDRIPIFRDPPESKEWRKLLDPLVSPRAVKAMEPMIDKLITELVDKFIEKGSADLAIDLAQPLTAIVTMRMAGFPESEWREYADPVHKAIWQDGAPLDVISGRVAVSDRIMEQIKRQRTKPVEGGWIAHLLKCEFDGRKLTDKEIHSIMELLLDGGVDTTQALLGSAFVYLSENHDQRQKLIDRPELMPTAVEELLRVFAPQQALARTATRDVEVNGQKIKAGEKILMCWAAGNRDAAEFPDPEKIDFEREVNRHMTFGMGVHRCMGSNIARYEAKRCLHEVLTRLPDFKVVKTRGAGDVGIVYGYSEVKVTFTPGKRSAAV